MSECRLCPRNCGVHRDRGEVGFCGASSEMRIARAAPHFWEEPILSGTNGAGTVFFSHCNMKCVYCQNKKISRSGAGHVVSVEELAEVFLDLQGQGCHNIDLVTPTHYSDKIARSIEIARKNGLVIPTVYNCGGYESVDALRRLEGLVDIYMPDLKYFRDDIAVRYSTAPDYFNIAAAAIDEMYRQTGRAVVAEDGLMKRGVLVRHLVLPKRLLDSKRIMDYLSDTFGDRIFISLMSQYTPVGVDERFSELLSGIDMAKYASLVEYCARRGMENVFIQEEGAAKESFIPDFEE